MPFLVLASTLRSDAGRFFAAFSSDGWIGGFGERCADDSSLAEFPAEDWTRVFDEVSDGIANFLHTPACRY